MTDVGGTFTDVVLKRDETRRTTKVPTTAVAPEQGVLTGIHITLSLARADPASAGTFIHGTTLATEIYLAAFGSGRHLAAWVGLTSKEHSTGGKQRAGKISRAGNERPRGLFVCGAISVINARPASFR